MRLITRADASLVGGLIASALILFHQPLRSVLDAAREIEGQYHLDLLPALIVLGSVFIYHLYGKRQQWQAEVVRAKEQARHYRLRTEELEALVFLARTLSSALDHQALRDAVVRGLPPFSGERPLWVLIKERGQWEMLAIDPITEHERPRDVLENIAERVLSGAAFEMNAPCEGLIIESTLCFPLVVGGTAVGVMGIGYSSQDLDPPSRRALGVAASTLSVAVRNVHLLIETRELSIYDSLTGCLVRKPGMAALEMELRRARRSNQPLSVLMIDVDQFKEVNDEYGHLCGDLVLSAIGTQLREKLRTTDHKCRYGGDEFVVVLPGTSSDGAERVAATLQTAIQTELVEHNGQRIPVTVSIGIACSVPGDLDPKAVLHRADQALYRQKADRRSQGAGSNPVSQQETSSRSEVDARHGTLAHHA
jgi:diguanylate cyclase (GGDEF)-like protein